MEYHGSSHAWSAAFMTVLHIFQADTLRDSYVQVKKEIESESTSKQWNMTCV